MVLSWFVATSRQSFMIKTTCSWKPMMYKQSRNWKSNSKADWTHYNADSHTLTGTPPFTPQVTTGLPGSGAGITFYFRVMKVTTCQGTGSCGERTVPAASHRPHSSTATGLTASYPNASMLATISLSHILLHEKKERETKINNLRSINNYNSRSISVLINPLTFHQGEWNSWHWKNKQPSKDGYLHVFLRNSCGEFILLTCYF